MDWRKLLLSPQGRIGRRTYWIFVFLALLAGAALGMVDIFVFPAAEDGVLSRGFGFALTWPGICILGKRLHDLGHSAWVQLAPYAGMVLALPLLALNTTLAFGAMVLVFVAFYVWVGFTKGKPGANKYGEPNSGERDVAPVAEVFS